MINVKIMFYEEEKIIYLIVLVRVSVAIMKYHDQKASWGRKGLLGLHFHLIVHHQRKSGQELTQDRNLEAEADIKSMEECCLLA